MTNTNTSADIVMDLMLSYLFAVNTNPTILVFRLVNRRCINWLIKRTCMIYTSTDSEAKKLISCKVYNLIQPMSTFVMKQVIDKYKKEQGICDYIPPSLCGDIPISLLRTALFPLIFDTTIDLGERIELIEVYICPFQDILKHKQIRLKLACLFPNDPLTIPDLFIERLNTCLSESRGDFDKLIHSIHYTYRDDVVLYLVLKLKLVGYRGSIIPNGCYMPSHMTVDHVHYLVKTGYNSDSLNVFFSITQASIFNSNISINKQDEHNETWTKDGNISVEYATYETRQRYRKEFVHLLSDFIYKSNHDLIENV